MSQKIYIGKGTAQKFGVKVTLNLNKSEKFFYEFEGQKYLTFFVNELKEPDNFGKTHSVHIVSFDETTDSQPPVQEQKAAPKKKSRTKRNS